MRLVIFAVGIVVGIAASFLYLSRTGDEFGRTYDECLRDQQLAVLESGTVEALGTAEHIATKRCDLVWEFAPQRTVSVDPELYNCDFEWGYSDETKLSDTAKEQFSIDDLESLIVGTYSYQTGSAPRSHGLGVSCKSTTELRPGAIIELTVDIDGVRLPQIRLNDSAPRYELNSYAPPGTLSTRLDLGQTITKDQDIQVTVHGVTVVSNEGERRRAK